MASPVKSTMACLSIVYVLLAFTCSTANLQTIGQILPSNGWANYGSVPSAALPNWSNSWQQSPYDYNTNAYYTGNTYFRTGRESKPQGCASAWAGEAKGSTIQRNLENNPQPSQQSSRAGEHQGALWAAMHQLQQAADSQLSQSAQPESPHPVQQLSRAISTQDATGPEFRKEMLQSSRAAEQPNPSYTYSSMGQNYPSSNTHPNKDQFMREFMSPLPNYALGNTGSLTTQFKQRQPQAYVSYASLTYPAPVEQMSNADSGHPVEVLPDVLNNNQGQAKASNAWEDAQTRSNPGSINIKWLAPAEKARAAQQNVNPASSVLSPALGIVNPAINPPASRQLFLTNPTAFLAPGPYQLPQAGWGYNPIPAERILPQEPANAYSKLPPLPHQSPQSPGLLSPVTGVIYDPSLMRRIYGDSNYVPPVFSLTNELSNRTRKLQQDEIEYNKVLHGEKPMPFIPARESEMRQNQGDQFQNQLLPPNMYRTKPWEPSTNLFAEPPLIAYGPNIQPSFVRADNTLTPLCRQKRQIGNFWDIYPTLLPDSPLQQFGTPEPGQMSQRSMEPLSPLPGLLHNPLGQSPWFQNPNLDIAQLNQPNYYPMQSRGAAQGFQQVISGLTQMVPFFSANGVPGL